MKLHLFKWLNTKYPQNFIVKKPFIGTLIYMVFCIGFVIVYKPFNLHPSRLLSYNLTMMIYFGLSSVPVLLIVMILKRFRFFSVGDDWTFLKEFISLLIILSGLGITIYFLGFVMEPPAQRWNMATFLDSCKYGFLVGVFPFTFFTVINYQHLFAKDIARNFSPENFSSTSGKAKDLIQINSRLKKEELSFYPSQLIYAESDGNYVVFYLNVDQQVQKKIIRNSISNIENQLLTIPHYLRTHRAFIVNVNQVLSEKGNTLGYHLKLKGVDSTIPVSRQNTRKFDQLLKQYR